MCGAPVYNYPICGSGPKAAESGRRENCILRSGAGNCQPVVSCHELQSLQGSLPAARWEPVFRAFWALLGASSGKKTARGPEVG